jgi:hypothetical protein
MSWLTKNKHLLFTVLKPEKFEIKMLAEPSMADFSTGEAEAGRSYV